MSEILLLFCPLLNGPTCLKVVLSMYTAMSLESKACFKLEVLSGFWGQVRGEKNLVFNVTYFYGNIPSRNYYLF